MLQPVGPEPGVDVPTVEPLKLPLPPADEPAMPELAAIPLVLLAVEAPDIEAPVL